MTENNVGPETIEGLADGALAAFAMLAGMQLDIFSTLEDGPASAVEIAGTIGSDPDKTRLLLYTLVVAGLMTEEDGIFRNTAESDKFLVNTSPTYMGARHHNFSYSWGNVLLQTADSVRTGRPQAEIDFSNQSRDEMEAFLRGLHPAALAAGRALAGKFDFSSCRNALEVGAGMGGVTLGLTESYPDIKVTLQDFPAVTSIAEKIVRDAGLSDRVSVLPGDALNDPLGGPYDVSMMRALIQVLNRDQAQKVLMNVGRATEPGGTIYIIGRILDDTRTTPTPAVLFNLNFLNIYDGGQAYTHSEHREWLDLAGFEDFKVTPIPGSDSIISARKR
ncbi:MAG: methyltransferase domain-containing protein [Chloroflexi bacterium]|nr:methyltransferase domain-containing protein [Chloroflexota bacterium]